MTSVGSESRIKHKLNESDLSEFCEQSHISPGDGLCLGLSSIVHCELMWPASTPALLL